MYTETFYVTDEGHYTEDFLAIFPKLDVVHVSLEKGDKVFREMLVKGKYRDRPLCLCRAYDEGMKTEWERDGLIYQKDFVFARDIARNWISYELTRRAKGRPFLLYGAGKNGTFFFPYISELPISACIDRAVTENTQEVWQGIPKLNPDSVSTTYFKNHFVIITSKFYDEIRDALLKKGLREFEDFLSFRAFQTDMTQKIVKAIEGKPKTDYECPVSSMSVGLRYGEVFLCPYVGWSASIGTIRYDAPEYLENSVLKRAFQVSIKNRNNAFCRDDRCDFIYNREVYTSVDYSRWNEPKNLNLKMAVAAYDNSCNLYCASCRDHIMGGKTREKDQYHNYFMTRMLPQADLIKFATVGEVFASAYYKEIFDEICQLGDKYALVISNGTMATVDKIRKLCEKTRGTAVAFSVDAGREETYKMLRRGGNFQVLLKNIHEIGELRNAGELAWFIVSFVVQEKNYMEMRQLVRIADENNIDAVNFIKADNWGMWTDAEYEKIALLHADRSPVESLKREVDAVKKQATHVKVYFDEDSRFMQEAIYKCLSHGGSVGGRKDA